MPGEHLIGIWIKSSHSVTNGECVEMAILADGMIGVRDSKAPNSAVLKFTRGEIDAFMRGVADGEFDRYR